MSMNLFDLCVNFIGWDLTTTAMPPNNVWIKTLTLLQVMYISDVPKKHVFHDV